MDKINFQDLPSTTTPVDATNMNLLQTNVENAIPNIHNSYNTSTTDGYSANYINGLNTYSTTEKRIGTWIDGKPLYRRVLQATFDHHTSFYYHDFSVSNISKIIKYEGFIDAVNQAPIIFSQSEGNQMALYFTGNNRIRVYSGTSAYSGVDFYLIITYTKTTD